MQYRLNSTEFSVALVCVGKHTTHYNTSQYDISDFNASDIIDKSPGSATFRLEAV